MALDFKDIFGNQAREEITRLNQQVETLSQQLTAASQKNELLKKYHAEHIASIDASSKSRQHHDSIATEYRDKNSRLIIKFDEKKLQLNNEIDQTANLLNTTKTELANLKNSLKTFTTAIAQAVEKQQTISAEIIQLTSRKTNLDAQIVTDTAAIQELSQDIKQRQHLQEGLKNGNSTLIGLLTTINRHADPDLAFSVMKCDLMRSVEEDCGNGAFLFNVELKPLCLIVDVGMHSTALALVRVIQGTAGEIVCDIESKMMISWGASLIENLMCNWAWSKFASVHSQLSDSNNKCLFKYIANRLMTLLIMNAPFGEIEESVTIDSEQLHLVLPFAREEITPLFMPVTGPGSDLPKTIKTFLKRQNLNAADLDRIVCMGTYSRLPFLQDSLKEVFGRQVVQANTHIIAGMNLKMEHKTTQNTNNSAKTTVQIITTDPHRVQREKEERERIEAAERAEIEEQQRQKRLQKSANALANSFKCFVTGMEFVFVEGGTFQMGDTFDDGESNEKPAHEVNVSSFYIGKYQVTQAEWQKIMDNNPSQFRADRNPVDSVSWNNTQEFIKKLNAQTGKRFRLPTEAEWEYAARSGGENEKYAGGNNVDAVAWYGNNSGATTHKVGCKQPNGLGIYDMSGNVWELCMDWRDNSYYENSPKKNPQGPTSGDYKIARGGSYFNDNKAVRATQRLSIKPSFDHEDFGLRLVLPQN